MDADGTAGVGAIADGAISVLVIAGVADCVGNS